MIHIVFNEPDVKVLQDAIALDETLAGDIVQIKDDFAVGPIHNCYVGEGITARREFWSAVVKGTDAEAKHENGEIDDLKTVAELVGTMRRNEEEIIWVWMAQNKHDVCGYYWLLHYLKDFQGRVMVLYLNNLPFINEKGGIFYPNWLSEIPAKEFLKAKKLAREITPSELEVDPDEWAKLCQENKCVRLLEGGKKIVSKNADYYDCELKKYITTDFQKVSKVVSNFLHKAKETTGDLYIYWRIQQMAEQGEVEVNGSIEKLKEFEVKLINAE